jgi:hypothetical protein
MNTTRVLVAVLCLWGCAAREAHAKNEMWRRTWVQLVEVRRGVVGYHDEHGRYPVTDGDATWVTRLERERLIAQRSLGESGLPVDAWGHEIIVRWPSGASKDHAALTIYSVGANGVDDGNTGDDVCSVRGINDGQYGIPPRRLVWTVYGVFASGIALTAYAGYRLARAWKSF